jgi:outer membrane murein-binding lipoprotein Lpp
MRRPECSIPAAASFIKVTAFQPKESHLNPLKQTLAYGALVGCMLAGALPVAADDLPLTQQVEQLRREVQALQARVRQLEQQQHTDATAGPVPAAPSVSTTRASSGTTTPQIATVAPPTSVEPALQSLGRLKAAWKGIDSGMSEAQVRDRLGTPGRIFTLAGKTIWYYSYEGVGSGSVAFSANSKKVTDWQNPPFGFW